MRVQETADTVISVTTSPSVIMQSPIFQNPIDDTDKQPVQPPVFQARLARVRRLYILLQTA